MILSEDAIHTKIAFAVVTVRLYLLVRVVLAKLDGIRIRSERVFELPIDLNSELNVDVLVLINGFEIL
jgi:hypothetical protein